jgi:hypothetical protein
MVKPGFREDSLTPAIHTFRKSFAPKAQPCGQLDPQPLAAQSVGVLIGSPSLIAGKLPRYVAKSTMSDDGLIHVELQELAGVHFIVQHPTQIEYAHQCGGLACYDLKAEGFLVPCPNSLTISEELHRHFYLGPKYKGNCYNGIDDEDAALIDELLASVNYGILKVNRQLKCKSFEAWVHLKCDESVPCFPYCYNSNPNKDIVMIWENSD